MEQALIFSDELDPDLEGSGSPSDSFSRIWLKCLTWKKEFIFELDQPCTLKNLLFWMLFMSSKVQEYLLLNDFDSNWQRNKSRRVFTFKLKKIGQAG